jgi:hypothetical protein
MSEMSEILFRRAGQAISLGYRVKLEVSQLVDGTVGYTTWMFSPDYGQGDMMASYMEEFGIDVQIAMLEFLILNHDPERRA